MGQQIIRQPDGRYAVWSTIVEDFLLRDATQAQLVEWFIEDRRVEVVREVGRVVTALEKGEKPYYQFTMTWAEAVRDSKRTQRAARSE